MANGKEFLGGILPPPAEGNGYAQFKGGRNENGPIVMIVPARHVKARFCGDPG
jgi:hypothetical protein